MKILSLIQITCILLSGNRAGASRSSNAVFARRTTAKKSNIHSADPFLLRVRGGGGNKKKAFVPKKIEGGDASVPASVFNLVNNVAGAGILTLSAGMAGGTGWVPAVLVCTVLGLISSHTFKIIGKACELTGEVDFKVRVSVCV